MMNSCKIGRNDPCPCGSGKKYKNCCLGLDEIAGKGLDVFERYNQLLMTLKVKLDGQYESEIKKIRREARQTFLRFTGMEEIPADHETLFSDWLWFDFPYKDGMSLAQKYYRENGSFIDKYLAECLQELNHSSLSIFTPLDASDASLMLNDLITGTDCRVMLREPWEIEENLQDLLLLGRLVDTPQGSLFSGMVLMQKNDAGQKEFIQCNLDYFKSIAEISATDFRRQHGEISYGIFCHALNKSKLSLNDIRAMSRSGLGDSVQDINSKETIIPLYQAGGWQWFQPAHCNGYARVALNDDTVLICTDLAEDLPVINAFIAQIGGSETRKVCNLLQSPDIGQTALWFAVMKDQETERWLHTPHRELGGQPPLEVLGKENGRRQLIDLLDNFAEEKDRSDEEKELLLFMRERIEEFNSL